MKDTKEKGYPLLKKAPKDHNSEEFLQFLRENNNIIREDHLWLIIENCKYHTFEIPWHTAFFKEGSNKYDGVDFLDMLPKGYKDWMWLKKAKSKQTVKRFHIHLIKK